MKVIAKGSGTGQRHSLVKLIYRRLRSTVPGSIGIEQAKFRSGLELWPFGRPGRRQRQFGQLSSATRGLDTVMSELG